MYSLRLNPVACHLLWSIVEGPFDSIRCEMGLERNGTRGRTGLPPDTQVRETAGRARARLCVIRISRVTELFR